MPRTHKHERARNRAIREHKEANPKFFSELSRLQNNWHVKEFFTLLDSGNVRRYLELLEGPEMTELTKAIEDVDRKFQEAQK